MNRTVAATAAAALALLAAAAPAPAETISIARPGTTDDVRPSKPIRAFDADEYGDVRRAFNYWESERASGRELLLRGSSIRYRRSWFWPPYRRVGQIKLAARPRLLYTRYQLGPEVHCKVVVHLTGRAIGMPPARTADTIMGPRIVTWGKRQYVEQCDKNRNGVTDPIGLGPVVPPDPRPPRV